MPRAPLFSIPLALNKIENKVFRKESLVTLLLILFMAFPLHSNPQPLEAFEWKFRLILVRTTAEERSEILDNLSKHRAGIEERHILWFVMVGDAVESNYKDSLPDDLTAKVEQAGYWKGSEAALLIGKDGGIKARQKALNLATLFDRIDSMPMRRAEMREQE